MTANAENPDWGSNEHNSPESPYIPPAEDQTDRSHEQTTGDTGHDLEQERERGQTPATEHDQAYEREIATPRQPATQELTLQTLLVQAKTAAKPAAPSAPAQETQSSRPPLAVELTAAERAHGLVIQAQEAPTPLRESPPKPPKSRGILNRVKEAVGLTPGDTPISNPALLSPHISPESSAAVALAGRLHDLGVSHPQSLEIARGMNPDNFKVLVAQKLDEQRVLDAETGTKRSPKEQAELARASAERAIAEAAIDHRNAKIAQARAASPTPTIEHWPTPTKARDEAAEAKRLASLGVETPDQTDARIAQLALERVANDPTGKLSLRKAVLDLIREEAERLHPNRGRGASVKGHSRKQEPPHVNPGDTPK